MTDVGSHHFVKSTGKNHRVLVPQPSEDPHDPLNWSTTWKISAIIAASFVTFTQGFGPLSLAPMFGDYIVAFHTDLAGAVQFTGVSILVLGFSNFIWYLLAAAIHYHRTLTTSQGPNEHFFRSSSRLYYLPDNLPRFCHLACPSKDLWLLHGC